MAEAEEQEGTPSLAEQWALDNDENKGNGENPEEKVEDVDPKEASKEVDSKETESTDDVAVPAAVDVAPLEDAGSEEVNETPETTEAEETAETAEEEEASEDAPAVKIETAPADFRFPTTNQTRHCFTRYVEYHRCINAMGEGAPECDKFAKYYRSLCPSEWVERWNEQRENGTFPGPL